MKKQALGLCAAIFILASWTILKSSGSPCDAPLVGGHTGAPGETSCSGCHAGTDNAGSANVTFTISGGMTQYTPGQIYSFTVSITQSGIDKMGFSCLALKNSNNSTTGSFQLTDAIRTRTYTDGPRNYVSHRPCAADALSSGFNEWSFNWQAPMANEGNITLYLGALATNHNHSTSGDYPYTRSIILTPAIAAGTKELDQVNPRFTIFPNPTQDKFEIRTKSHKIHELQILDLQGRIVKTFNENNHAIGEDRKFSAKQIGLNSGAYFLKLTDESTQSFQRLIVQ